MTIRPTSIEQLRAAVAEHARVRIRSAGTKPGLCGAADGSATIDMSALAGVTEHVPEECTFTALAGTRLAHIERLLAAHGQYLPFDPPLVDAGATLGGTVAAGVNGSCRYRYGGIRDFLIGAHVVDGRGTVIRCGGKVVKNAAGFLLHQTMVGSCGRLGVLADLTFKVFPHPPASATVVVRAAGLSEALSRMGAILDTRMDVEAIDIDHARALHVRVSGFPDGLGARVEAVRSAIGTGAEVVDGEHDGSVWREAREFAWLPPGSALVRVPVTLSRLVALDEWLDRTNAVRRYAMAGNLAWIAWPGGLDELSRGLTGLGLAGQVLIGSSPRPFIGAVAASEFERRVRAVMDPDARFAAA